MRVGSFIGTMLRTQAKFHVFSIVEFGSQEDAQRAIRELSEVPLLGRPVFIREVRIIISFLSSSFERLLLGPRNRGAFWRNPSPW